MGILNVTPDSFSDGGLYIKILMQLIMQKLLVVVILLILAQNLQTDHPISLDEEKYSFSNFGKSGRAGYTLTLILTI